MKSQQQRQQQQHSHCLDSSNCNYLFDIFGVIFCFNDNATSEIKQRYTYAMLYRIGTCKHTHTRCVCSTHISNIWIDQSSTSQFYWFLRSSACFFFSHQQKTVCSSCIYTFFSCLWSFFSIVYVLLMYRFACIDLLQLFRKWSMRAHTSIQSRKSRKIKENQQQQLQQQKRASKQHKVGVTRVRASEREEKKVKHFLGVNYNVHCEWFIDL